MALLQHLLNLREVLLPEEQDFMQLHQQSALLQDFDGANVTAGLSFLALFTHALLKRRNQPTVSAGRVRQA